MTERLQMYKCEICGNIVEVLHPGAGQLACCGQPMKLLQEQTADWKTEKHVPVVEEGEGFITVKVGSVPHPMEESHFIEWIDVVTDHCVRRVFLKPGDAPEAKFTVCEECKEMLKVREHCNVHGLWRR